MSMAPAAPYGRHELYEKSYESDEGAVGDLGLTLSPFTYDHPAFIPSLPSILEDSDQISHSTTHDERIRTSSPLSGVNDYSTRSSSGSNGSSTCLYSPGSDGSPYSSSGSDSSSTSSGNFIKQSKCLRRLQFRDQRLIYNRQFQVAKATEEAAAKEGMGEGRHELYEKSYEFDEGAVGAVEDLGLTLSPFTYDHPAFIPSLPSILEDSDQISHSTTHDKRIRTSSPLSGGNDYSTRSSNGSNGSSTCLYSPGSEGSPYSSSGSDSSSTRSGNFIKQLKCLRRLQVLDQISIYNRQFQAAKATEEAAAKEGMGEGDVTDDEEGDAGGGMRLLRLLIACAEAVACRDRAQATELLSELRANALVFGTSFQRVASCFVQGLENRLAQVQPLGAVGVAASAALTSEAVAARVESERKDEALRHVYDICPHIQFGHLVANCLILEAFEGESMVHVVDLGMALGLPQGQQWRALIDGLATRADHPPRRVRVTGVGICSTRLRAFGDKLEVHAKGRGIKLEFLAVESKLEDLKPEHFKCDPGEVLVVNSILQLHRVVKESRGALNSVLQVVHELSPKALVLVEQDSSHNGPFFLGRFMEALHYYSAIFDSLDVMLPKYDTRRAKIEQFYFAEEIKNIVSCEGPARVERHERVDQWRRRMSRAGFQPSPIKVIAQVKQWLDSFTIFDGYTIAEEKGCLVLGWKSKPIVAASCWKC